MDSMHIARPYAHAFFQQAKAVGQLQETLSMLSTLRIVTENVDFRACLTHPACTTEKQHILLPKLVSCHSLLQQNMLTVLIQRRRLLATPCIHAAFQEIMNKAAGQESAVITSAQPLTQKQQKQLIMQLEQKRQTRIYADFRTDPSLLGGYKVHVGDHVENRTVRYQLTRMKDALIPQQDISYGND